MRHPFSNSHMWLLVFECEGYPIGSCVWSFGPQLVTLWEKTLDTLGNGVLLKKVCVWGLTGKLHLLSTLYFLTVDTIWRAALSICHYDSPTITGHSLELWVEVNPFFLKLLWSRWLRLATRKVVKAVVFDYSDYGITDEILKLILISVLWIHK